LVTGILNNEKARLMAGFLFKDPER